ncbi:helix-turn-helix transcriptional regulator [Exilibacterium tricleocarpae]|uniref:Helix-turn-helix transcriptional regulator n=1 Tax=Exilibacterium tricleocarpae TaxID=2591008 RepID=A0A545T3T0_9GAMM|nr:AraC family transcriptional regulator [Exilibacterium tricleocarpae]TQV71848.1 helix-turn-helix transcriptional regulator [Exilibacterium tricleocarpae]
MEGMDRLPALISGAEYEDYHPGTVAISSKGQKYWDNLLLTRYLSPKCSAGSACPATTDHILAFSDSGAVKGHYAFNTGKWQPYVWRQREWLLGQAFQNACKSRWNALSDDGTELSVCYLHLSPTFLENVALQVADRDATNIELPHQLGISDPLMLQLGLALRSEAECPNLYGKIFIETAAHLLATHLLKNYSTTPYRISKPNHRRHGGAWRTVIDYIHSKLDKELSLQAIAGVANMSPYHFAHTFKDTMGIAPHRYIIKTRIEKAKRLLRDTNLPINLIALEVGYTSSHFIRMFKRLVGVSPGIYRKQI